MFLMEIHQPFLTDKDIEMYTANPHAGKGKGALVALLQLGLTGPADKVERRRLECMAEKELQTEYMSIRAFGVDCKQPKTRIMEDIMQMLEEEGTLSGMDAA